MIIQIHGGGIGPTARNFTAAVILQDDVVVKTAPILQYMNGWTLSRVEEYCRKRHWTWTKVEEKDEDPNIVKIP